MSTFGRRAFIAASATALAASGLTGCGRFLGSSGGSDELTIAEPDYHTNPRAYDDVTQAFRDSHQTAVKQVSPPFDQYSSQVFTQLQAQSPPDLIRVDDPQIGTYLENDWLEPLDDVLDDVDLTIDDLVPPAKDMFVNGSLYGILVQTNPRAFIYNEALYQQAGLEPPDSVSSLEAAIKKTTNASNGVFGLGFNTKQGDATGFINQLTPFIYGFDGNFFDGTTPTVARPENIEAMTFLQRLWKSNLIPRSLDSTSINSLIQSGKLASNINGAFVIFYAKETDPDIAENLTTAPTPFPGQTTMRASALWAIPRAAKNKEAAREYLRTFLNMEVQQQFQAQSAFVVARRGGVSDSFIEENPWFEVIRDAGEDGSAKSYFPTELGARSTRALKTVAEGVLPIFHSQADPEKALKNIQTELLDAS